MGSPYFDFVISDSDGGCDDYCLCLILFLFRLGSSGVFVYLCICICVCVFVYLYLLPAQGVILMVALMTVVSV